MRTVILAVIAGLSATAALAGQDGTDVFAPPGAAPEQPGQGKTPPPVPTADSAEAPSGSKSGGIGAGKGAESGIAIDLTFGDVEGAWTGTVDEVDQDPYTISLTFRAGGLGEVAYAGYDCSGVLGPLTQGAKLVFKETITIGRDTCADGTVVITPNGAGLNWTWINEFSEVQATAVLNRKP